jgi:type I phosphodiesterase/nucleotide pyrophosphatase
MLKRDEKIVNGRLRALPTVVVHGARTCEKVYNRLSVGAPESAGAYAARNPATREHSNGDQALVVSPTAAIHSNIFGYRSRLRPENREMLISHRGAAFVRRSISILVAVVILAPSWFSYAQSVVQEQPKLVLLVVIDQFRYDYLTRFREQYTGGLNELLTRGAVFENANLEHYPTVTAIGHTTSLSGATPALSGIIGNDWYDREEHKRVLSISDDTVKLVGGSGDGASPRRLLVSTIGDQLKKSLAFL